MSDMPISVRRPVSAQNTLSYSHNCINSDSIRDNDVIGINMTDRRSNDLTRNYLYRIFSTCSLALTICIRRSSIRSHYNYKIDYIINKNNA